MIPKKGTLYDNITTMLFVLYATDAEWRLTEAAAIDIVFGVQGRERRPSSWTVGAQRARRSGLWASCIVVPKAATHLTDAPSTVRRETQINRQLTAPARIRLTEEGRVRLLNTIMPTGEDCLAADPVGWLSEGQVRRFAFDPEKQDCIDVDDDLLQQRNVARNTPEFQARRRGAQDRRQRQWQEQRVAAAVARRHD